MAVPISPMDRREARKAPDWRRPLTAFLLCLAVVVASGGVVLVAADGWLNEPGADLFGRGVRSLFLIWIVVLFEAPFLAAVSAHFLNLSAGYLGTVAGAAVVTLACDLLEYPQALDVKGLLFVAFFASAVVGIPVAVEFGIVGTLRQMRVRHPDQVAGIVAGLIVGLAVTLLLVWYRTYPVEAFVTGCIVGVVACTVVVVAWGRHRRIPEGHGPG
jgi:hypothetical protein